MERKEGHRKGTGRAQEGHRKGTGRAQEGHRKDGWDDGKIGRRKEG